jgi:hypothetical protein
VDLAKSKSMFHERLGKKSQGKNLGFLNYLRMENSNEIANGKLEKIY